MAGSYTRSFNGATDDRRRVTFMHEAVYNEGASLAAGRPIYRDEERIEIAFPGNALNIWHGRVTDEHRNQYPAEYEAFLKGEEVAINGTPIEQLTVLNKAQVKELKHFDIFTIEDAAALSEQAVQRIGMGGARLREMAKKYLEQASGFAPIAALVAQKEDLEGKLAMQAQTIDEMNRAIIGMQAQLQHYAVGTSPPQMAPVPQIQQPNAPVDTFSSLDGLGEEPRKKRAYRRKAA